MKLKSFLITGCILFISTMLFSQNYVEKMNTSNNFFEVKKAADAYFNKRTKETEGSYKKYKRWEEYWGTRFAASGGEMFNTTSHTWDEVIKYRKSHPNKKIQTTGWEEMGPNTCAKVTGHWAPGIGRVDVIRVDPANQNNLFVGTPTGGLWKSTDGGSSWECLTDDLPSIGIAGIAVDWSKPATMYIATGDMDLTNKCPSIGVLKSTDGGHTWNSTGLSFSTTKIAQIMCFAMHPTNPNILFAGTSSNLMKTTDGGNSWSEVVNEGYSIGFDDIEFKPGDPTTMYTNTWNYGGDVSFYKSINTGDTWSKVSVSGTGAGRVQIAVTAANPNYVYYASATGGVYRSTDSGSSFTKMADSPNSGNQAIWDFTLAANDTDADQVFIGEIESYRSNDGGKNWEKITEWNYSKLTSGPWPTSKYIHCDMHEMVFVNGTFYTGSDGLICKSTDGGDTWANLTEGLGIRQFNKISCSQTNPLTVAGGSQDNGTTIMSNGEWHEWLGADGSQPIVDWSNENVIYGCEQSAISMWKTNDGGYKNKVYMGSPESNGGAFVTPLLQDPLNAKTIYAALGEVYKSTDGMSTWNIISDFGWGWDNGSGTNNRITGFAIAKSDPNYIYASENRGIDIRKTTDGGKSWTAISSGLPSKKSITSIAVHPGNPEIIAVCLTGYSDGEKVYMSTNGGSSWTNISGSLPNLPANAVCFEGTNTNALYVGMDVGVYYIDNTLTDWKGYMTDLPNVVIKDLEIQWAAKKLRAGTHGRGLWQIDLYDKSPIVDFISKDTNTVTGRDVKFTDLSVQGPTSWSWTFEGGTPSTSNLQNPTVTYAAEGIYQVTLVANNAFGSDAKVKAKYITVVPAPTSVPDAEFEVTNTLIVKNMSVEFTDLSTNLPTSWSWTFEGGTPATSTSQNPTITYAVKGKYKVTLVATNEVGSSNANAKTEYIEVVDLVGGYCTATTTGDNLGILNVELAEINNASADGDYSDFTNISTPLNKDVKYTINLTVDNDYWGENALSVWIDWNQDHDFDDAGEVVYSMTNNAGYSGVFTVPSTATLGITMMRIRTAYSDLPPSCGTDTYLGEVEDYTIIVKEILPPVTDFSANITNAEKGKSIVFTDKSSNSPSQWAWTFEGGTPSTSTQQNPTVTFSSIGDHDVSLTTTNISGSNTETKIDYISIFELQAPLTDFVSNKVTILEGQSISFTDVSTNNPNSWSWTFEGGTPSVSNAQNPVVTYNNEGVYKVSLTTSNAIGSNTKTKNNYISVSIALPITNFTSDKTTIKEGQSVSFTDVSTNKPSSWSWTFEGGTPSVSNDQNPIVKYNTYGLYDVSLTTSNISGSNTEIKTEMIEVTKKTSIEYKDALHIDIIPNPNNGLFKIQIASEMDKEVQIKIISTNGKVVYNKAYNKDADILDLSKETKGIYVIQFITENKIITRKFVLE